MGLVGRRHDGISAWRLGGVEAFWRGGVLGVRVSRVSWVSGFTCYIGLWHEGVMAWWRLGFREYHGFQGVMV